MHEELNKAKNNINSEDNGNSENQSDKMAKFNNFVIKFCNENKSLIRDIFFGINLTSIKCSFYKVINYEFDIYYFLSFPIEEIKEYKIQQINNQMFLMNNMINVNPYQNLSNMELNINSINIYDCFQYKKDNIDTFTGAGSINCNNCGNILIYTTQTNLYTAPKILIIGLNKGRNFEINIKIEFFEDLNSFNFTETTDTGFSYKLIGVVTYIGNDGENKKFFSYCKNPIDIKWYKFENDFVIPVINFQNEIMDYGSPYILFYQKTN